MVCTEEVIAQMYFLYDLAQYCSEAFNDDVTSEICTGLCAYIQSNPLAELSCNINAFNEDAILKETFVQLKNNFVEVFCDLGPNYHDLARQINVRARLNSIRSLLSRLDIML